MSSRIKYRPEVDGLRSVAVLPVVLFHLGVGVLPGGFVGVDIFFVISGFLITSILASEIQGGQFSLWTFYKRRALRILPALLFLVIGVVALAFVLLPPSEIRAVGDSLPYIATFTPNLYFSKVTNYFAPDAASQPLLHTWSLGVEEQFYIAYPLALALLMTPRFRKLLHPAMWLMAAVSFALCLWLVQTGHFKAAFYMFPARAWEFALGAVVALGGAPKVAAAAGRLGLSGLGLALILVSMLTLNEASAFPSWNAIPPALGAALIIAYAEGGAIGKALGSAAPRIVGKVSYSLYLWHWPVIVMAHRLVGDELSPMAMIVCVAVMSAATAFSYLFIEKPFRSPQWSARSSARVLVPAAVGIAAACALGPAVGALSTGALIGQGAEARRLTTYLTYEKTEASRRDVRMDRCFLAPEGDQKARLDTAACLDATSDKPRVLVFGDSHAAYLTPGLRSAFPEASFLQATAAGCTPVPKIGNEPAYCSSTLDAAEAAIRVQRYSAIVLGARWQAKDVEPLAATVRRLRAQGQTVVVIGPIVEYSEALPAILARQRLLPLAPVDHFQRRERAELDRRLAEAVAKAGALYVSQRDALCAGGCPILTDGGVPVAYDYGHYTTEGANLAGAAIRRAHPDLAAVLTRAARPAI